MKFASVEEFEKAVNSYFDAIQAPQLDKNGKPVVNQFGEPMMVYIRPATMTGLALHIGLASRQAILNYSHRSKAYEDVVKKARMRVQEYCEQRLFDRDGAKGAQFSLRNNFDWVEKQEVDLGTQENGFSINVKFDE